MKIRKMIGWGVAQAYRLAGARRRAVDRVRKPGVILPVVFHAAKAEEVRAILGWLGRAGVLEQVWLSFDDGWREFKDTVRVLEEFEKPATLFVAPGETMRGDVWTDGLTVAERQRLYGVSEEERYKCLRFDVRGSRFDVAGLKFDVDGGVKLQTSNFKRQTSNVKLLTSTEIREVAKHPLVRIGNHTWSHLSCPHRPVEEVLDEVDRAQATLTEWCGYAPTDFAYPFGRGTPELDAEIRKRGMTPHYTRQGLVTKETLGAARNMVYEGMSLAENLGRILTAWPRVGETL